MAAFDLIFQITLEILVLFIFNSFFGLGFLYFLGIKSYTQNYLLYSQYFGIAITILVTTFLSYFGYSINSFFYFYIILCLIFNLFTIIYDCLLTKENQIFKTIKEIKFKGILISCLLSVIVIIICCWQVYNKFSYNLNDIVGSSDFCAYWSVSDYLIEYCGNIDCYLSQDAYKNIDIEKHLTEFARLGSMVYLAYFSKLISTILYKKSVYASLSTIYPIIIYLLILFVNLLFKYIKKINGSIHPLSYVVLAHPFLYFISYHTYYGQIIYCVLILFTFFYVDTLFNESKSSSKEFGFKHVIFPGILFSAIQLSYPSALIIILFYFSILLLFLIYYKLKFTYVLKFLIIFFVYIFVSSFYLKQSIIELILTNKNQTLPGWNWSGLIGIFEFFGISNVMGGSELPLYFKSFNLYKSNNLLIYSIFQFSILTFIIYIVIKNSIKLKSIAIISLLLSTLLMCSFAYIKYNQNVFGATHAFVKSISQFVLLFYIIFLNEVLKYKNFRFLTIPIFLLFFLKMIYINFKCTHDCIYKYELVSLIDKTKPLLLNKKIFVYTPSIPIQSADYYLTVLNPITKNSNLLYSMKFFDGNFKNNEIDSLIFISLKGNILFKSVKIIDSTKNYYSYSISLNKK